MRISLIAQTQIDRIEGARLNLGLTEAEATDALIGDGLTELADWYVNWLDLAG